MILKLLLIIGVISLIYFFFIKEKPAIKSSGSGNKSKREAQSCDMVECSTCGIYCEVSDALISGNKYYCSNECLEKA